MAAVLYVDLRRQLTYLEGTCGLHCSESYMQAWGEAQL